MTKLELTPEEEFALLLQEEGFPEPVAQYRFDPRRRWRFDFAWPKCHVAVELEGGSWTRGGHRSPGPEEAWKDCEKLNKAQIMGWIVLRLPVGLHTSEAALAQLRSALNSRFHWFEQLPEGA
jgi:hypothetical protein